MLLSPQRIKKLALTLAICCLPALLALNAQAQDLQNLLPTHGRLSYISIEGARSLKPGEWNLSSYAHYGRDPLLLTQDGQVTEVLVRYITTVEMIAALSFNEHLELGLAVPYHFTSGVSSPYPVDDAQGLGDIRLNPKVIFVRPEDGGGFGIGTNFNFILPTGDYDRSEEERLFVRRNFSGRLNVFAEYFSGAFRAALNAGYLFRPARGSFDNLTDLDLSSGPTWGAAAGYQFFQDIEFTAEIFQRFMTYQRAPLEGLIAVRSNAEGSINPVFAMGAGLGGDFSSVSMRFFGGFTWTPRQESGMPLTDTDQDGLIDLIDRCPKEPEDMDGLQDHDGCPEDDVDRDTIPDDKDACPEKKEDIDQFEDQDGCPDIDNDRDGIIDQLDRCPLKPETVNQFEDQDGCPDQVEEPVTEVEGELIGLSEKIFFKHNESIILRRSHPVLSQVAALMKRHPKITLVRIEGHTDDTGSPKFNLNLSQERAEAVKLHLVSLGVDIQRLESVGYGDTRPIASNDTEEGRALNRRVDFRIIQGPQEIFKVDTAPPPVPSKQDTERSPSTVKTTAVPSPPPTTQADPITPAKEMGKVSSAQPVPPPPSSTTQTSDTRPYAIQVKASYRLQDAEKVRDALIKARFPAYVLSVEQGSGRVVHRVRIGPYPSKVTAQNALSIYQERYPEESGFYLVKITKSEAKKYR